MILFLLFLTGLAAGTVDAIAGGGGLISLPVLIGIGIPPHIAFGTNKLQGTIGTFMAARRYYRHGLISLRSLLIPILFGLAGGIAGALAAQVLSSDALRKIIPVLLFVILIYTIFSPRMGHHDGQPKISEPLFYILAGFGLSFYDGFFGPGTGSFWVFLLTFFLGFNLIKATAYTKVFNLNSSFIATICFALGNNIDYRLGFCMAAGQLIGGRLGAGLAIKKGARLIRPLFLTIVTATIVTMLYKTYAQSLAFAHYLHLYHRIIPQIFSILFVVVSMLLIYQRRVKRQAVKH